MANEYVPIFFDWIQVTEELNAQEKGRLIDAIVLYAQGGDWQEQIKGNERYLFPAFRKQIDRANNISAKRSAAGTTGGKQNQANRSKTKQTEANASKIAKEEEKEEEKEKEYKEDEDGYTAAAAPVHRFGSDLSPSQIQSSMENDRLIEDAAKDWGLPCNPGNMVKARDLAREYSIQWLIEAMKRAGNGKSQTWAYVEGILRSFKANGGPDTPGSGHRVIYPEKRVSAQNYQQRQYTEAELMAVSGDLVAEARKLREEMPKSRTLEEQAAFEAEQESDIAAFLQKEAGA